jgi:hypothetical protein
MSLDSAIIGLSEDECDVILQWIGELKGCSEASRRAELASWLGEALERYMGIEGGILARQFLFGVLHDRLDSIPLR